MLSRYISRMGGKSSKNTISDEDLNFLMKNTKKSADEIQVKYLVMTQKQGNMTLLFQGVAQGIPEGLPQWRADQGSVCVHVQQDVPQRQCRQIQ